MMQVLGSTALREMLQRLQRTANKCATLSRGESHVPSRGKTAKAEGAKSAEGGSQGGSQKRKRDGKPKDEGARKGAGRKRKAEASADDSAGGGRKRYVSTVDAEGIPQYPTTTTTTTDESQQSQSQLGSQPEQRGALDALAMAASGSMEEETVKDEGA